MKRQNTSGIFRRFLLALCLLLCVNLAGCQGKHQMKTPYPTPGYDGSVYVIKQKTQKTGTGQILAQYDYEFDENGNPLKWEGTPYWWMSEAYHSSEFDSRGNPTVLGDSRFEYEYDAQGRIETCYQSSEIGGSAKKTWKYTWDEKGRLICVALTDAPAQEILYLFVYDSKGRLEREYRCYTPVVIEGLARIDYGIRACEYEYDRDGRLTAVNYGMSIDENIGADADEIEIDFQRFLTVDYADGLVSNIRYSTCNIHDWYFDPDDIGKDYAEASFAYDADGNWRSEEYACQYDRNGNLIRVENYPWFESVYDPQLDTYVVDDSGCVMELSYEKVKLSEQAAARYQRWRHYALLDPHVTLMFQQVKSTLLYQLGYTEMYFFYYLIPNPIW